MSACRRLSTLTLPALAQAPASAPVAAGRLDAILARGVLRVGSTGDCKPFTYRSGPTGASSAWTSLWLRTWPSHSA